MRPTFIVRFSLCCTLFTTGFAFGQHPANQQPPAPTYDAGFFAHDTYSNECMGISFPVPSGWLAKSQGISGPAKAIHLPGGSLNLLMIEQPNPGTFGNTITLFASPATEPTGSARDFVAHAIETQIKHNPQHNQFVRETFPVDYAGKHFFRADFKTTLPRASFRSLVFTRFRDYYIGEMIEAATSDELDRAADSLKVISFREDVRDPKCATGEIAQSAPLIGIISSHPVVPTSPGAKILVSQKVSQSLLVKRLEPEYPELALQNRVEGNVLLVAVIGATGDVEDLRVASGPSVLAAAAIAAVRQWKYKPYELEGRPLKMETQVTVEFQLPTARP